MSGDIRRLFAVGDRVRVDTVVDTDIPAYRRAVSESRERIRHWNPVNADDLTYHLSRQGDDHRTFIIRALPEARTGGHDIVGKVNLTGISRGRAHSGVLGYDAYDPYAGRGLFAEGLSLVVDIAFRAAPHGVGLHRVEAAVQPGNVRSAGLLRSLGFRRRGDHPRYLWLADGHGQEAWRDHVVYGVDRTSWPGVPYAPHVHDRPVVVVTPSGDPDADVGAARALAIEMGVPVLRASSIPFGRQVADAVTGAVLLPEPGRPCDEDIHPVMTVRADDLSSPAEVTRVALLARHLARG